MKREGSKKTWGGFREGAGRPKAARRTITPHRARPALSPRHPVHVVLRLAGGASLRYGRMYRGLRRVLERYLGRVDFRVVHLSIQSNHIHLLVEAAHKVALSRGVQSLAINFARAIHAIAGGRGKVFEPRYHATQITTPRQARNSLAYVLNNWRRHRHDVVNETTMKASLDPYASGILFDGWRGVRRFAVPAGYEPLPVSPPTTRLLRSDWRRFGEIDPFECPGPMR